MDLTSRPPLATIGVRFAAILLDGLLASVLSIPAAIVAYILVLGLTASPPSFPGQTMQTIALFVILLTGLAVQCYCALVLAMWAYGLTPGKWLLGVRVVKRDTGTPSGFWRMTLRETIGKMVSSICYLGYIWAIFDANRQAWHDKIASTLVIKTR
jgi:uncharacterized RDD family membrane protein YckC